MSERAIVEDVDDDGAVVEAGEDAVEVLSDEEADAQSVTEAAAAAAAAADEPIPTALDEHVVPDLGLTVAYPRGWHAWTSAEFAAQGGVACFTPENVGEGEQPGTALNVLLYPDAGDMDLDKYTELSLMQLRVMFDSMPADSKGKLAFGPDSVRLADGPGCSIEYVMQGDGSSGGTHRYLQAWTLRHGAAFILMFSAPMRLFRRLKPLVDQALARFAIRPEAEALLKKATAEQAISAMYGIPLLDKQHCFRIHYPAGWKLQTSRKMARAARCEYRGRLSHAPDESEVLLSYDVTVEPLPRGVDDLAGYTARLCRELRKATGCAPFDVAGAADAQREPPAADDADASADGAGGARVALYRCAVGGQAGHCVRFRSGALAPTGAASASSAFFELRWTVANHKAYVLTFTSTAPAADRRAEPLFARLAASFELVPAGFKAPYATRRYENLQLRVRLDYPINLAVREKVMGAIVSFIEELPGEEFGSHVNFVSHRLEEMNLTGDLDQFADVIKQQMPTFVSDYTLEQERDTTLGGEPAKCIVYRGKLQPFEARFAQFFTIHENRAFIISYAVQADRYEEEFARIQDTVLSSFTFF